LNQTVQVKAQDTRNTFPKVFTVSPKGVNIQTGRLMLEATDLKFGPFEFIRYYGTDLPFLDDNLHVLGAASSTSLGTYGWNHIYNEGIYSGNCTQTNAPSCSPKTSAAYYEVVVDRKKYWFTLNNSNGTTYYYDLATEGASLTLTNGQYIFVDRSGTQFTFSNYPAGAPAALRNSNTNYPNQGLQSAVYPDGRRLDYVYNSIGQLVNVVSNLGYAVVMDYDVHGNASHVCGYNLSTSTVSGSTTCANSIYKATYSYDSTGNILTSVTDNLGHVVGYSNASAYYTGGGTPAATNYLGCVTLADSSQCELTMGYGVQSYDAPLPSGQQSTLSYGNDQVRSQTTANGNIWKYSYSGPAEPCTGTNCRVGTVNWYSSGRTYSYMTDPLGNNSSATYDFSLAVFVNTPSGSTTYKYNGNQLVFSMLPLGNSFYLTRDNRENLLQSYEFPKGTGTPVGSDGNGGSEPIYVASFACCLQTTVSPLPAGTITTENNTFPSDVSYANCFATTPKICNKPTSKVDANGNETDYTYDTISGNVLTETGPAVNSIRPQTRYSYVQRTAWTLSGSGGYIQNAYPIWLLASKSVCKTGAAGASGGCAIAGDEVITTYDYGGNQGPNNLLLNGEVADSSGLALRTCYRYDTLGNKISQTTPRSGLTTCQ
jgi:hypothetical protein